jgi:methylenetetrahydrofolate dehydrogenase (NADP+) / methenyltetrahydrofolate cyclohydrolase
MKLLDGKLVSKDIYTKLEKKILYLKSKNVIPCLSVIIVGDRPDSKTYVKMKEKKCQDLRIKSKIVKLNENITSNELVLEVEKLNNDTSINGILIQLPLPEHIEKKRILDSVDKHKDVDGFNIFNMGSLALNRSPNFYPCTPLGCINILNYYNISVEGKHIVVIGKSQIVGLPLSLMLMNIGATISVCDDKTINIKEITKTADILFVACGCPKLVTDEWIKEDVVIIDIGINKIDDKSSQKGYKIVGDVDFESVKEKVSLISPVPGGVGPMTIAMLMDQTIKATEAML